MTPLEKSFRKELAEVESNIAILESSLKWCYDRKKVLEAGINAKQERIDFPTHPQPRFHR